MQRGQEPGSAGARYDLDELKVLVVDDADFMRHLLRSILHALRITNVTVASSGADAFAALRISLVDIILVDWHMEPMDGLEFVRLLRTGEDSPNPYIPVIMVTANTQAWRVAQARDVGVNEFIAKPLSPKGLYQRIIAVIDGARPFVRTSTYFGPDRRRRNLGPPEGIAERRVAGAPRPMEPLTRPGPKPSTPARTGSGPRAARAEGIDR